MHFTKDSVMSTYLLLSLALNIHDTLSNSKLPGVWAWRLVAELVSAVMRAAARPVPRAEGRSSLAVQLGTSS